MFKKITFFIFAFFLLYIGLLSINKVSANEEQIIYLELGITGYDYEIEDSVIVSGTIDFNNIGEYKLTYFNKITKSYFNILYIVTDSSDINYFQKMIEIKNTSATFTPNNIIYKDGIVIVASYKLDPAKLNSLNDKKAMINVYNGTTLRAMMTYSYYSEVVKMVFSQAGFIALVRYDDNGKNHFKIIEYNLNGEFLREYSVASNAFDKPQNIIIAGDYIYLVFNSSSNSSPFISKIGGISTAFIAKINYLSFEEVDYISFGNNTSNEIIDSVYNDDYLYVVFKPFGSGDFLKKLSGSKFIVKLDKDLHIEKYIETDNDDGYFDINLNNDTIYLFTSASLPTNKITISAFDLDLNKGAKQELFINNNDYLVTKIISYPNHSLFVNGKDKEEDTPCMLGAINIENGEFLFHPELKTNFKINNIEVVDNEIYLYGISDKDIIIYDYYYLNNKDDNLFLNNNSISGDVISDTFSENNLYGANQKIVKFRMGNSFYIKKIDYYLPLESSIMGGSAYELGTKIYANGRIYLDDLEIKNGYSIERVGTYLLKVYGTDNEVAYLEFSVKQIINEASSAPLIEVESVAITNLDYEEYKVSDVSIRDINIASMDDNNKLGDVGIILIILSTSLIIAFIIPVTIIRGRN
ncbi:MAG: hypothetical protein J6W25_01145 [Bacilli bacterium]|nr:hypothetical protein [Bacilli bacterium]